MNASVCRTLVLFLLLALPFARQSIAQQGDYFLNSPAMQKFAVILGGAAAEKKYEDRFREWTLKLYDTLSQDYRYSADHISLLFGTGDPQEPRISDACRLETIEELMSSLQAKVKPGDQIIFFIVGHGTSDGEEAKFNIVGPDISGHRFAELLAAFSEQNLIVVNTTSSSYLFVQALSAPGRILISATRSRAEKYDTIFASSIIEALANHAADMDKNTRLSLWESFQYARKTTEKWYNDQERLPTEHPALDDNGDGVLSTDPDPSTNDGRLAQIAYLDLLKSSLPTEFSTGKNAESARQLMAQMLDFERSILLLRNRKDDLLKDEYYQQLEPLLIKLARTTRKFRNLQKSSASSR
ncbi:MAG: hypothetical protein HQM13_22190 [SAR324 cluster bacterium]|nr:hypothetical protein [SAR324 cluster bacterium]